MKSRNTFVDEYKDKIIVGHQAVVGFKDTEIGNMFEYWIKKYGVNNITFICSFAYNLGMIHGKRSERARRKR